MLCYILWLEYVPSLWPTVKSRPMMSAIIIQPFYQPKSTSAYVCMSLLSTQHFICNLKRSVYTPLNRFYAFLISVKISVKVSYLSSTHSKLWRIIRHGPCQNPRTGNTSSLCAWSASVLPVCTPVSNKQRLFNEKPNEPPSANASRISRPQKWAKTPPKL